MWYNKSRISSKDKWITFACLVILSYLMPYYILGEDTHIRVHDNLDSNIVWYKILAESGQIFAPPGTTIANVINGLPRSALSSSLDLMTWLYVWFEPFTAYTINQTIMRFVAFFGMYGLLRFYFQSEKEDAAPQWVMVGIALGFALLPFWPSGALSIAGLPLALLAFLNIRDSGKEASKLYWIILVLLPFHSSLILTFVFFLALIGILWLFDWFKTKKVNLAFLTSIVVMGLIFLTKNYLVISSMFFSNGFISHRVEFELGHNTFPETIRLFLENFIFAHNHDKSVHQFVILPTVTIAIFIALYKKVNFNRLAFVMMINVILSLWYAFWYWEGWRVLKDQSMLLNTFNFSRIHFLHPLFWYLAFAFALVIIGKNLRFGKPIAFLLMSIQIGILFNLNEEITYDRLGTPTFNEFYSQKLFGEIKTYIDQDPSKYKVVSVAMHPTIAQFNGMHTLDTYNVTYPLSYKHNFRQIIAPELAKNQKLENYFDTWGGRLYMFVGELGKEYMFTKNSKEVINNLDINTKRLKQLGGDYVLSALPIENHQSNNLKFERTFQNKNSPWNIYLYKVR